MARSRSTMPISGRPWWNRLAREVYFVLEESAELGRRNSRRNGCIGHAKALHVVLREVDAVFGEVHADILPEIRELQRGAGGIRQPEALFVRVAAGVEDQPADRVGGIAAVAAAHPACWRSA